MKPELQRIAIAEACEWRRVDVYEWKDNVRLPKQWIELEDLPDYLNDLNAMHEAEEKLPPNLRNNFMDRLDDVIELNPDALSEWHLVHATAAQRAEAFLRTKGKWTD